MGQLMVSAKEVRAAPSGAGSGTFISRHAGLSLKARCMPAYRVDESMCIVAMSQGLCHTGQGWGHQASDCCGQEPHCYMPGWLQVQEGQGHHVRHVE